jgi:hypothetical protein
MLDAFASVGAQRVDLTLIDLAGHKVAFRPGRTLDGLRPALGPLLRDAAAAQQNVIVRPRAPGITLIQLDDLDAAATKRVKPFSFLILCTSPGNYQAWVAMADADADFARRLRKGVGADLTASGATRVSGSWNFKGKYAPAFPRVETVHVCPGRIVTAAELEALGVVAPQERLISSVNYASRSHQGPRGWPNYQRCLEKAPPAREGGRPDISRVDFTWCLIAIDWGWDVEETAARLMQESNKARENGQSYALRTARSAASAIERRGGRQR